MELEALLTSGGGLNKDAKTPQAYLKLFSRGLCLESNRHLSILLEVILKTDNKDVLKNIFMHKGEITGLHILVTMLWKFRSNMLMIAILRKGLRVVQHLEKHGVIEGRCLVICTHRFCMHMICKLLYDLTKHEDHQVRALAFTLQKLRFEIPKKHHSTHLTICEEAMKKARRKCQQQEEGLEDGEIPVEEE